MPLIWSEKNCLSGWHVLIFGFSIFAFIQHEYQKKANEYLRGYLLNMHVGTKLDTIFIRLFLKRPKNLRDRFFPRTLTHLLDTKNYVACEAHREQLLAGMEKLCL